MDGWAIDGLARVESDSYVGKGVRVWRDDEMGWIGVGCGKGK